MTRIILTRHGQTLWNIEGRVQGSLDSPLTEKGILQARSLALRLKDEGINHIYTSDSLRAINTAEEIRKGIGLKKYYRIQLCASFPLGIGKVAFGKS